MVILSAIILSLIGCYYLFHTITEEATAPTLIRRYWSYYSASRRGWFFIENWLRDKFSPTNRQKAAEVATDLSQVDWTAVFDTTGLQGDWASLFAVWFFEQSPPDLGVWEGGSVTISEETARGRFLINDLKSRPQYQTGLERFRQKFPTVETIKPGDNHGHSFVFTGPGTAEKGKYTIVEWFLGSYTTTFTVTEINPAEQEVSLEVTIKNSSTWQSGTRMPRRFQERGIPPYLVPNEPREGVLPGGDFHQKFIWREKLSYKGEV